MKLIPDWRQAWRMLSVQVASLAIVWGALPVDQQAAILALFGVGPERVPLFIGLAVIVARVVSQQQTDASAAAQRAGGPGGPTGPV